MYLSFLIVTLSIMSTINNQQVAIGKLMLFFDGYMYELIISNAVSLLYHTDTKYLELCVLQNDDNHYVLMQHSNDNLYNVY